METQGKLIPFGVLPPVTEATSKLNNLLQIISGTTEQLENIWEGSPNAEEYFAMLRSSVAQAAEVTAQLVERSEKLGEKVVFCPEIVAPRKAASDFGAFAAKQHILVVDDDRMVLALARRVLSEAGYEVSTAASGFECLDLFRWEPLKFDLILLDLTMPMMDGEETFLRLRTLRPDVFVILCSGYVNQERLNNLLAQGLSGFMRKPLGNEEYLGTVRAVLEQKSLTDRSLRQDLAVTS